MPQVKQIEVRNIILIIILLGIQNAFSQKYTLQDLEGLFFANNTLLMANRFNVSKAEAEVIQERLWSNPSFSISEVNLWKNNTAEVLPHLFGKYGKHQQVSLELEQMIETAGKRKKRVAIKSIEKDAARIDFEELLRELKKELRTLYYSLEKLDKEYGQLLVLVGLFDQLEVQYERQSALKNIRMADYYRVRSEAISLRKELVDLENDMEEALSQLRILTHLPKLELNEIDFSLSKGLLSSLLPLNMLEMAKNQNIELLRQGNDMNLAMGKLALEKAERVPNVNVQLSYDRGGNIMQDFVGLGLSVDIPVFNKNKGNIRAAALAIDQQKAVKYNLETQLEQELDYLEKQIKRLEKTIQTSKNSGLEGQEQMIENYKKHLQNKEVTLMEFIDFVQSYREAKQALFELEETYYKSFEELQYIVGNDF